MSCQILKTFDIYDVSADKRSNAYLLRFSANRKIRDYEVWLGRNNWPYITILSASVDISRIIKLSMSGLISAVETIPYDRLIQISFKLIPNVKHYEVIVDHGSYDILIALYVDNSNSKLDNVKEKFLLDVIVIDPGHGGKDPGAIGVYGKREKDITLAVAKKLKTLIEQFGVKAIMTRQEDDVN
jgi:N-acetylmuramoyl-L-alanine amidase